MIRIDAHVHFAAEHLKALELVERLDLKLHNVSVGANHRGDWRVRQGRFQALADARPDRFAWTTAFDPPDFSADYADRVIAELDRDFAAGARACKVWKNIGMTVRKPDGSPLMVDDPVLTPVFEHLARNRRPVMMHLADPISLWQPPQPGQAPAPGSVWGTDVPPHAEIIAARDRLLDRHRDMVVVGAHLGSQCHDLPALAERLERFPHFAVDTSARLSYIARHDHRMVREFFLRYADRIIWGTDIVKMVAPDTPPAELEPMLDRIGEIYRHAFMYYESAGPVAIHERDFSAEGLNLPAAVLDKFYSANARRWLGIE